MNEPERRQYGDTWEYLWPDTGYAIGFSALRESKGELHGEIWVGTDRPADNRNGHVVWGSFNLSAPTSRAKMAVQLHSRTKHGTIDQWVSMLEYACLMTAEEFRQGEPVRDLSESPAVLAVDYLVHPILPAGEVTTIFADGESCKSVLALGLCLSLTLCAEVIPGLKPTRRLRSLYLDWETSYEENVRRQEMICRGLGLQERPPGVLYRHMTRALGDDLTAIRTSVDREHIGLVVVDSAAPATGAEAKDSDPTIRFMAALRALNAGKLVLGHVTKETAKARGADRGRMYGSVFYENLSRNCWELRAETETDPISVGFFHRKANMGRKVKPFAVTLRFDDVAHAVTFRRGDIEAAPAVAEHAPLSWRLAAALRRGPRSTADLAEDLGVSEASVRSTGRRGVLAGNLVQLTSSAGKGGRGNSALWALAASSEGGQQPGNAG